NFPVPLPALYTGQTSLLEDPRDGSFVVSPARRLVLLFASSSGIDPGRHGRQPWACTRMHRHAASERQANYAAANETTPPGQSHLPGADRPTAQDQARARHLPHGAALAPLHTSVRLTSHRYQVSVGCDPPAPHRTPAPRSSSPRWSTTNWAHTN